MFPVVGEGSNRVHGSWELCTSNGQGSRSSPLSKVENCMLQAIAIASKEHFIKLLQH